MYCSVSCTTGELAQLYSKDIRHATRCRWQILYTKGKRGCFNYCIHIIVVIFFSILGPL